VRLPAKALIAGSAANTRTSSAAVILVFISEGVIFVNFTLMDNF